MTENDSFQLENTASPETSGIAIGNEWASASPETSGIAKGNE